MINLFDKLKKPILIVGIGNPMKGDDGAGPAVAEGITPSKDISALNCLEAPENYIGKIARSGAATVLLADAAEMGEKPGAVRLMGTAELREAGPSTHSISLSLIADTVREESGAEVFLLGIQPKAVKLGEGLSEEVAGAVKEIISCMK